MGLAHHIAQRGERHSLAAGLAGRNEGADLALHGLALGLGLEGGTAGPGHGHRHQGDEAGIGDHRVERQAEDRQRIVRIQPGALALAPAEGEEVDKDLLVRDHTADNGHQHEHRAETGQPAGPEHRHVMELEVEAVEELAAHSLAAADLLAGLRIEHRAAKAALALRGLGNAPERTHDVVARIGHAQAPLRAAGHHLLQLLGDAGDHFSGIGHGGLVGYLGPHPLRNLFLEIAHRTGEKHRIQNPAHQQAGPDVQVGHGLANAACGGLTGFAMFFIVGSHAGVTPFHTGQAASSSGIAASSSPSQARVAERTANTQTTAPV